MAHFCNIEAYVRIEFADGEPGQNREVEDADASNASKCGLNSIANDIASREGGWPSGGDTAETSESHETKAESDALDSRAGSVCSFDGLERDDIVS